MVSGNVREKNGKVKKGRRHLFEYYYFKFNIYSFVQLQLLALCMPTMKGKEVSVRVSRVNMDKKELASL